MPSLQIAVQNEFHQKLRKEAIAHLANSRQVVARSFRQEYLAAGLGAHKQFLHDQEKTGIWGTYIEAVALSEKYNVNLVVTPVTRGVKQHPICLYRSDNPDAKTVHLFNSDNTHWYVDSQTKGDGNCLYNAYAQALYNLEIIKPEQIDVTEKSSSVKSTDVSISYVSIFSNKHQEDVRTHQEAIQSVISKAPTPAERQQDFEREKERISKLSPEEQKQISDDHAYALSLARGEGIQISAPNIDSNLITRP